MRNFVNLGCGNMQDVGGTKCKFESWGNCLFGALESEDYGREEIVHVHKKE